MASRDYVRRGKGSRKRVGRKKTPVKKTWRVRVLAVLLVGGFSYGLYILSHNPKPSELPDTSESKTTKPKKINEERILPPPHKEQWDYVKTLPNKEVKVEAKEQVASNVSYVMQCGAFKSLSQAKEREVNIAFQGLSSQIHKKENSSWYRVVLGPYKFKRNAEKDRYRLQRAKIEPCAIWKDTQ